MTWTRYETGVRVDVIESGRLQQQLAYRDLKMETTMTGQREKKDAEFICAYLRTFLERCESRYHQGEPALIDRILSQW